MFKDKNEFLVWEASSRDVIDVKRIYIDIAKDIAAGIFLSQLIYWYLPTKYKTKETKTTIKFKGKDWVAIKRSDWWDQCRLTKWQIDRAIQIFKEKNLIETCRKKFHGLTILHVYLNFDVLFVLLENIQNSEYCSENKTYHPRKKIDKIDSEVSKEQTSKELVKNEHGSSLRTNMEVRKEQTSIYTKTLSKKTNKEKEKKAEIPKEGIPLEQNLEEMGEENKENIKIKDQNSTRTDQPDLSIKNSIQKRDEILKKCLTKFNNKGKEVYEFFTSISGIRSEDQLERFTNSVFSKFTESKILETFSTITNRYSEGRMPEYNASFVLDAFTKQKRKTYKQEYKNKKLKTKEPEEVVPKLLEQSRIGYEEIIDNELGNYDFTCSCCGEIINIWYTVCPNCEKRINWKNIDLQKIKQEAVINIHD